MPTKKQPKPRPPRNKREDSAAPSISEQELENTLGAEDLVADATPADIAAGEHEGANPDAELLRTESSGLELHAEWDSEAAPALEADAEELGADDEMIFAPEEIEAAEDVELVVSTPEETAALEAYYADDGENHEAEDTGTSLAMADSSDDTAVSEAEVIAHQEEAAEDSELEMEAEKDSGAPIESTDEETISKLSTAAAATDDSSFSASSTEAPDFGGLDHGIEEALTEEENEELAQAPPAFRSLEGADLMAAVEATFFMHHKPINISKLRELINPRIDEEEYRTAVSNLMAGYADESRGIELVEVANGYQFRTKPQHKDIMRRMYQIAPMKLTNAMLEVLSIAAYNQPITRETVDRIRGVDSSHLVRVLLDKKMLRIVGKSDELGRPMLYGTTKEFLEVFGLRDLSSLPSLRELEDMLPKNEVGAEISEEDMLAKEMEGIVENAKPLEFNDLELEESENNETQKIHSSAGASAETHGHGSPESIGSAETGEEAGGEGFHLEAEAPGRIPFGPEGNA